MFNFLKKDKITFSCTNPKLLDFYPPVYSKDIPRHFLKKINENYKNNLDSLKNPRCPFERIFNTARCPGILEMISSGYIFKLHRDIRITTNGNLVDFKYEILGEKTSDNESDVTYFDQRAFSKYYDGPSGSLKTILKINLPWLVDTTDYCFIQTQPSFLGENRFTVVEGILDPIKARKINVILYWNVLDGTEIITAGTPMCQLIPIKRNFLPRMILKNDTEKYNEKMIDFDFSRRITNNKIKLWNSKDP